MAFTGRDFAEVGQSNERLTANLSQSDCQMEGVRLSSEGVRLPKPGVSVGNLTA